MVDLVDLITPVVSGAVKRHSKLCLSSYFVKMLKIMFQ